MSDTPIDETFTEEQALASLHTNVGWGYMKRFLEKKRKQLQREFETVEPNDASRIAAIQAELKLINKIIDKPKRHFERQKN